MTLATVAADKPPKQLDLSECLPSEDALACLAVEIAQRLNVLPIAIVTENQAKVLLLACVDASDQPRMERISRHINKPYEPRFIECSADQLLSAISQSYRSRPSLDTLLALASERAYSAQATDTVHEFPVAFVNAIIVQAAAMRASDIHLSPEAASVQLRLRVDGVLLNFASVAKALLSSLLVRIKIMASLDIAETRYPQDGQFRRVINGSNIDFRVSTFPTVEGENTVLRLIDSNVQRHSLSALNLPAHVETGLATITSRPEGLVVVCGPTGAGKSTTLFALLDTIDRVSRSVMTLEDPVEYRLAGVRQTSIDVSRHWGYSQGLRALLRQDPDVLLIGEIRDSESCSMALRAVSTGHQVLTTVHAANAHAALHRLRELGAGGAALALGLVAIVAQRLVRQVCRLCKGVRRPCSFCHDTGYSGRQVIVELLEITEEIKALLSQNADIEDIHQLSLCSGFETLQEQAMHQVAAGTTTMEEVRRVLGDHS